MDTRAPTVASLSSALGKHLAPATGFEAPIRTVTAVHISELVDPNAFLSGGELLLTTGLALPENKLGCRQYVARLMEADVAALALGLGPVHATPPSILVEACREAGLNLLIVPAPTPFLTISRAYWAARARSTEQQFMDAVAAHRALVDAATTPDPQAAILRRLVRLLGGWAALLDVDGRTDQVLPAHMNDHVDSLHSEVSRLRVAGVHSSAAFTLGEHVVAVYPLAVHAKIVGYLAVGTPGLLEPSHRRVVLTATVLLTLDVVRKQRLESAAGATRRAIALLIDAGMVGPARLLASQEGVPLARQVATILVTRGHDSEELVRSVERWCPDVLPVVVDRTTSWFVLPDHHPRLSELVQRLNELDPTASAGASELTALERLGPTRARIMRRVSALRAGEIAFPEPSRVKELHLTIDAFLEAATPGVRDALVAYLRYRGHWEKASHALGLHRNTLRYRVTKARELLGLEIDDPDVAAETWLALRATGSA